MIEKMFAKRRTELLNQIGENDIVIVPTSTVKSRNGDVEYQFRPDSDFYYLTGFEEPEAVAVVCPGRKQGKFVIFCRERDALREMWDGRRAGLEGAVEYYGADDAFPIEDIGEILPGMMEEREKVYTTVGRYPDFDALILSWLNKIKLDVRNGKHAPYELVDLNHILHEQRLIKRKDEVSIMRKAGKVSAAGHTRAMQVCKAGMYEYQVQAEMECEFRKAGSNYNAYPSIVAGGQNACILHYTENNHLLNDGDLLLIDAGAELDCYAADISRTFPVNGKFSPEQRQLYDIVLAAQSAAFEKCTVGHSWNEPHEAAVTVIAQGLIDEGLISGTLEQALETQSYTQFYMHRTGHWLGMDVHDVGDYQLEETWRELEPGMVFTVEPGIYVSPAAGVDERWHNIGIRIEDNVLVKKEGIEILTSAAPKLADDIEALMAA
ncbi:MAG: aminopeptidase P N-terminal domain-containing protein [Acidiferrobacterales bacterium]|nr:aminopeptidase P N-terminal domain-containing protein [Acidiferrobacterales bacterium]